MKKVVSYLMVVLIALMMALNYQLFVFPNSFAPAGLNGIFTMIQHVLGFKLSYTSILLNVPLAVIVFFVIAKPFALRSLVYAVAFGVKQVEQLFRARAIMVEELANNPFSSFRSLRETGDCGFS